MSDFVVDRYDIPPNKKKAPPESGKNDATGTTAAGTGRRYLMIYFSCCHVYSRIYRNAAGTMYEGKCPRCGSQVEAKIGSGGTSSRMFRAG